MNEIPTTFRYGEDFLTTSIALSIAKGNTKGYITTERWIKINASQQIALDIAQRNEAVYGINTGFGPLCTTMISATETQKLQTNILKSHSVGVGEPIARDIAKLMLILKVQALAQGFSGIAATTLERILWHIDHDAIPVVPSQGSVGASGDLAPLAHLFLPLLGLGEVVFEQKRIKTADLFIQTGLKPIELAAKEGLALINGTQFIAAHAVKVVEQLHSCLAQADLIGAMMLDALQGSVKPFHAALHALRPFAGNQHVAARISALVAGSAILDDHANCERVQDPYSLRCMPQVHGASRTAWLHLRDLLHIELNAVTDNPVLLSEDLIISGGNFHGQPLAMALDYACLAASELGNISDRRIYLALEGKYAGVPKLLMHETGINSAYMMLQYTSAALASENKSQCFPASADSIPTSLGQEDHVSMGSISARKALRVIENVEKILAIELLTAAQALDFRRPLRSSAAIETMHNIVRSQISFASEDRVFADDIEMALQIVREKRLLEVSVKSDFDALFETF